LQPKVRYNKPLDFKRLKRSCNVNLRHTASVSNCTHSYPTAKEVKEEHATL
jgi:hypothetical protein